MENFEYQAGTRILFGKNQIDNLPAVIRNYGKHVLLCYGGSSARAIGLYDRIQSLLSGCEIHEISGIAPNPKIESVRIGVEICRKYPVDVILAVGGGSVIDCAKIISAAAYFDGDAWEMIVGATQTENAIPLVTVLTVAATGSEYDAGAVISNASTNEKLGYDSELIRPRVSILDPVYSFSVPPNQTASGATDIISHLLEQYFAPGNTLLTDELVAAALKTAIHYAPIAIKEPENYEARAELMWLSSLACNGILSAGSQYGGWSCHAIEHELSAFYDITHGVGLAVIAPRWMRHILNDNTVERFAQYGIRVWGISENIDKYEIAEKAMQATEDFLIQLGLPMNLSSLNIGMEHFEEMAIHAVEANWLEKAYVPLNKEDVLHILNACL